MKKEKSTNTAIRIAPSEKEHFEKIAKDMGITFTDLLKKGAYLYGDLDPAFREKIQNFSHNLGIPEHLVLQNLAISWMARRAAYAEAFGYEYPVLDEFMVTENGLVTGDKLFNFLKADEIRILESEKEARLLTEAQYGTISNKEDAAWLKDRMEKYKNAAEAQKRAKENRARGLAYTLQPGEDEATALAEMKAKREKAGL